MQNQIILNITSPAGSHRIVVKQDTDNKRTINSSVDGRNHVVYACSANSSGDALHGLTDIWVWRGDKVILSVDIANHAVALDIAQAGIHYAGTVPTGQDTALVAFVKACGLPDLGA
jgi:hypothetical protein